MKKGKQTLREPFLNPYISMLIMIMLRFSNFIQNSLRNEENILKNEENIFKQQIYECPNCKYEGKLYSHGSYKRNVITEENIFSINIYRVKCPICKNTHALIPDFLIPYFQHSFKTIKKCLELKYLEDASYSNITNYFQCRNTKSYISASTISNFNKRFISVISKVKLFFNTFTEIYSNENTSAKELILFINAYNLTTNGRFNLHYFEYMPSFFMCKT